MTEALKGRPVARLRIPKQELVTVDIDPDTGLLAAPWCPGRPKTMLRQMAPTELCPSPEPSPTGSPRPREEDRNRDPSPTETPDGSDEERASPQPTSS